MIYFIANKLMFPINNCQQKAAYVGIERTYYKYSQIPNKTTIDKSYLRAR